MSTYNLVMDELARDRPLPAWLNEGLAKLHEYEIGLGGERPDAIQWRLFRRADEAKATALSSNLIPLLSLEDQGRWNSQTDEDRISLQYSEAYMPVRFLSETFGDEAPVAVVEDIGRGFSLGSAIANILGLPYSQFEQQFVAWLESWEDPERGGIRDYLRSLDGVLVSLDFIFELREGRQNVETTFTDAAVFRRTLVADATELLHQVEGLSPPSSLDDLQQDALVFMQRVVQWLTLELEHAEMRLNAKIVEANAMIPEINARQILLNRRITNVKFIYSLEE